MVIVCLTRYHMLWRMQVTRRKEREVWDASAGVQLTRPRSCNMHEFTALTPCCVVLVPSTPTPLDTPYA